MKKEEVITWGLANIPGCSGKYKANPLGQIVRVYQKSGKTKLMTPYLKNGKFVVKLTLCGKSKEIQVSKLICDTFLGPCPKDMVPYHKNRIKSDNRLDNLAYIKRKELGRLTGGRSRNKSVLKIARDGTIVNCYPSAREAGRKNNMSYQAVIDRCKGRVKNPFALDGYTYAYEDSAVSLRRYCANYK